MADKDNTEVNTEVNEEQSTGDLLYGSEKTEQKPDDSEPADKKPEEKPADKPDEKKPDEKDLAGKEGDPDENKDEKDELFGKPETGYDYKEIMPEGMELNKDTTEKFDAIATKYNMSQIGANELMALAVEHTKQTQTKLEQALAQTKEAKVNEWKEALNKDPEIGGAKLDEAARIANVAYDKFSDGKVADALFEAGLNHHPAIVKMFYNIGKQVGQDTIRDANTPAKTPVSTADLLYGKTTRKEEKE